MPEGSTAMDGPDLLRLPEDLPVPVDDGAASHLPGRAMPALSLPATDGRQVALDALGSGRTVVYIYPMTGRPGVDLPEAVDRLHLPFAMLSDEHLALVDALGLPTFTADGAALYRRLTMIITDG